MKIKKRENWMEGGKSFNFHATVKDTRQEPISDLTLTVWQKNKRIEII